MEVALVLFWAATGLTFYAYAGYPLLIALLGRLVRRRVAKAEIEPTVTILITAYNEEKDIAAKIKNCLELNYPKDKLEIVVASDGSTDGTDNIVKHLAEEYQREVRIVLHRVAGRKGKTGAQNSAIQVCRGDIIVFSDAACLYDPGTVRALVRNYADARVGAVSGRADYFIKEEGSVGECTGLFWRLENFIKSQQSRLWTLTGATGPIYSSRRDLYTPLPPRIISDLVEPLTILQRGYRVVFEPEARALEETAGRAADEFKMRIRVIVRGMNGILFVRDLLNPLRHPWVSFQLLSHKVSRWLVPINCLVALGANVPLALSGSRFYLAALGLQVSFYALAALGYSLDRAGRKIRILSIPLYFCVVNIASLISLFKVIRNENIVTWQPQRSARPTAR